MCLGILIIVIDVVEVVLGDSTACWVVHGLEATAAWTMVQVRSKTRNNKGSNMITINRCLQFPVVVRSMIEF